MKKIPTKLVVTVFTCLTLLAFFWAYTHNKTNTSTAEITQTNWVEQAKLLRVLVDEDRTDKFRAYHTLWKDRDVLVVDASFSTDLKKGDLLTFTVFRDVERVGNQQIPLYAFRAIEMRGEPGRWVGKGQIPVSLMRLFRRIEGRLDFWWLYRRRDWIEGGLGIFYGLTIGIGPALLGYAMGRWMSVVIRALPLLFILPSGYWWTSCSDHGFEIYVLGNALYAGFCVSGLHRRAKDHNVTFWGLHHFDWLIVASATVLMMFIYHPPSA